MPRFYCYAKLLLSLSVALLILSCDRSSVGVARSLPNQHMSDPVPRSRDADDVGRFLAGLPGTPGSPFEELEKEDAWQEHRRLLDADWNKVETRSLPAMRAFQKNELSGAAITNSIIFYPFSGPDALMLTVFFPRNEDYVMVGLEPAGTLPSFHQLEDEDQETYLGQVRDTVYSELHRSFFITRQMDRQFRGQVSDGLLPTILELLVRTGNTVLGFRYVRLDERGEIIERAVTYRAPGRIGNKGVEIDFRRDQDQSIHKLYYFSVNLSDDRLREDPQFLAFLSGLKGMTSFFKATSYMTHQPGFTTIRDEVLANSEAILQDDSGIPYRYLDNAIWQVQLFGSYDHPYGSFEHLVQPDLKKAYASLGPKPLDFRIGYGFGRVPSNLLLASRADKRAAR